MMNRLRRGAKSLTAKVLIALLVASFAVWGIGDIFTFRLDSVVAKVGDTDVPAKRFADALSRQQSRLSQRAGQLVTYDQLRDSGVGGAVLGSLIRDAAFEEELRQIGISAPDSAVAKDIRENAAFRGPDGSFSRQTYEFALRQQGMSAAEFEALTRTVLAQEILVEAAKAGVVPPPGVAQRIAAYRDEQRSANLLTLPLDAAADPGTPSGEALKSFYDEHKDMFREPERRWGSYLHVDARSLLGELAPSEDKLRATYEADKDRYATPATRTVDQITFPDRKSAEAAISRLLSGDATFESLAKDRSLTEADISLGKVTAADLPDAASGVVFGEKEPGIVGPVELPAGFAVYRVREVTPAGARPFEEVRDDIAKRLAQDALLTRAPEIANRIEELRAAGKTMQEIGKQTDAVFGTFEGLAKDGTLANGDKAEGLVASQPFIDEAFKALDAEERDLVETDKGGYFLVMVQRIEPSRVPPLDEAHDKAVAAWQDAERLKALEEKAGKIVERLGTDASIWDIGKELDAAVLPQGPFTRLNAPESLPAALIDKIFRVKSGEGAFAPMSDGKGVIVAQVSSVTEPPADKIEAQSKQIDDVLANSIESDLGEYYARAVVASHNPEIEWGVVQEVFNRLGASGQPSR